MANNVEDLPIEEPDNGKTLFQKQQAAAARRAAIKEGFGKDDVMSFGQQSADISGQALAAGQTEKMIKNSLGGLNSKGTIAGQLALLQGSIPVPGANEPGGSSGVNEPGTGVTDDIVPEVGQGEGVADEQSDLFKQMAALGLTQSQEAEGLAASQLDVQQDAETKRLENEIKVQTELLNQQFAPKFQRAEEQIQRAIQASGFTGAAQGSVRGSRQSKEQERIIDEGELMKSSIQAEQNAQLRLFTEAAQGASAERLATLGENLANAQEATRASQERFDLAEKGLLQGQIEASTAAQEAALAQFNEGLEAQGVIFDPISGELVTTLEGDKRRAEILKTNAQASELWDKINTPDVDVTYKTDELGNVNALTYNNDTGEFVTVALGKLGAAEKWALGVGKGSLSGGKGRTDFSSLAVFTLQQIQAGKATLDEFIEDTSIIVGDQAGTKQQKNELINEVLQLQAAALANEALLPKAVGVEGFTDGVKSEAEITGNIVGGALKDVFMVEKPDFLPGLGDVMNFGKGLFTS